MKTQPARPIPNDERVPIREKVAYSAASATDYLATQASTSLLWLPFFNLGLGLNAAVLSGVLMSDWLGPAGATVLFAVAGNEVSVLVVALAAYGVVFFTFYSFWSMPYYAVQMELTPNYDERTRVSGWISAFVNLNQLMGGAILWLVGGGLFATATGHIDLPAGVKAVAIPLGVIIILSGLLPVIFVKTRVQLEKIGPLDKQGFCASVKQSAQCGPMWLLIGISFFQVVASASVDQLGFYLNIFKVNAGDIGNASYLEFVRKICMLVAGVGLIPFWIWLAEKWDKKQIVMLLLGAGMFAQVLAYFCLRPDMPYLQILPSMFTSGVVSSIWLILPSMKADIMDYDELRTGRRREASLNSFYSWFIKAALTVSLGLVGVVIQHIAGIDPALAQQPEAVVDRLFYAFLIIPAVLFLVPVVLVVRYPLSRERMNQVRAELEARRGTVPI